MALSGVPSRPPLHHQRPEHLLPRGQKERRALKRRHSYLAALSRVPDYPEQVFAKPSVQGFGLEKLGIVRAKQRQAMLGVMETPLNYFFTERTDPRTLETLTRGPLAAPLGVAKE